MDYVYAVDVSGNLCHWGIKGMKWGIRRYQNKDGSLTPAGKKRYDDDSDGTAVRPAKKKSVKDMTDEEIRSAIARKQLENQYLQYHPEPVKPESFAKKFIDQAVKPAAINAGRDFIEKSLKKVTGDLLKDKVDPNSLEALEAANKKLRAKITNEWLKKGVDTTANWDAATKQYELQGKMEAEVEAKKKAKEDVKAAKAKAKADAKAAKAKSDQEAAEKAKTDKAKTDQEAAEKAKTEHEQRKARQRKEWEDYVRSHDETMKRPVDYFVGTPEVATGRTALDRIDLEQFMLDWDDD